MEGWPVHDSTILILGQFSFIYIERPLDGPCGSRPPGRPPGTPDGHADAGHGLLAGEQAEGNSPKPFNQNPLKDGRPIPLKKGKKITK